GRFLAPLAHLVLQLAPRLSLLLAPRQTNQVDALPWPDRHHDPRRPLARSRSDLSDLGRAPRYRPRGLSPLAIAAKKCSETWTRGANRRRPADLPLRPARLDLLSRREPHRRHEHPPPDRLIPLHIRKHDSRTARHPAPRSRSALRTCVLVQHRHHRLRSNSRARTSSSSC